MKENFPALLLLGTILSFALASVIALIHRARRYRDPNLISRRASHTLPTSRLGGLAVCISVFSILALSGKGFDTQILIAALPVFLIGLLDDINYKISPKIRLLVGLISASMFMWFKGLWISTLSIPIVDILLNYKLHGTLARPIVP